MRACAMTCLMKHALFSMFLAYIYSCSFELRRIVNLIGLLVQFSPFDLMTEKMLIET